MLLSGKLCCWSKKEHSLPEKALGYIIKDTENFIHIPRSAPISFLSETVLKPLKERLLLQVLLTIPQQAFC